MKPNSSMIKLSWLRIKKEPAIWILLLLCLYIVFAYYIAQIRFSSLFSQETVDAINMIAFSLSCSYIAGMVFYILSEFLIQTRKARAVLANTVEDLRLFIDDFSELSKDIWGDDWLTAENANESVFRAITNIDYSESLSKGSIRLDDSSTCIFKKYINKFDTYLTSIMSYESYLSPEDFRELTEIRLSFAFNQVRIHFDESENIFYSPKTLMELIKDIISINKKVVRLYGVLQKYGYDFQK